MRLRQVADDFSTRIPFAANGRRHFSPRTRQMRVNLSTRTAERERDLIVNSRNAKKWTRIFSIVTYILVSSIRDRQE